MADPVFESFLVHTATIERPTDTVGAAKRPSTSYAPVATGVRCRIKPVRADSKQAIGGAVMDSDHKAYFLANADVRELDQVTSGGVVYAVQGVERPVDDADTHHLTVHLKKRGVA